MSGFWVGVGVTLGVLLGAPAVLAAVYWLLSVVFERGDMIQVRPTGFEDRLNRSRLAAVLFTSSWVVRVLWVAGFGVIVYRQSGWKFGGESWAVAIQHGILDADERHPEAVSDE